MALVDHVLVTAPTGTGTQDITIPGFGTPSAILLFTAYSVTALDTISANAALGYAMGDSTNCFGNSVASMDAVTTINSAHTNAETQNGIKVLIPNASTSTKDVADYNGTITDGIQLDWTTKGSQQFEILAVFFDSSFSATAENYDSSAEAADITSIGFLSEWVLSVSAGRYFLDNGSDILFSAGVTDDASNNFCVSITSNDNVSTSQISSHFADDILIGATNNSGSINRDVSLGSFDTSGFTASTATGTELDCSLLALAGNSAFIGQYSTPTTVTEQEYTYTGGFTPEWLLIVSSSMAAINTSYTTGQDAYAIGISSVRSTDAYAFVISEKPGVTTSETQSLVATNAIAILDTNSAATIIEADFVSFANNAFTLDFTKVDTTARQFWVFGVGSAGASTSAPGSMASYRRRRVS